MMHNVRRLQLNKTYAIGQLVVVAGLVLVALGCVMKFWSDDTAVSTGLIVFGLAVAFTAFIKVKLIEYESHEGDT